MDPSILTQPIRGQTSESTKPGAVPTFLTGMWDCLDTGPVPS